MKRICILLCYLYHDLGDWECRACLCFCLFLLGNSLCHQTLTVIDCNGRKTVLDTQERTNKKGQVSEQLLGAEAGFEKQDKASYKARARWASQGGFGISLEADAALFHCSRQCMVGCTKERSPAKGSHSQYRGLLSQRSERLLFHLKGKISKQEQGGFIFWFL